MNSLLNIGHTAEAVNAVGDKVTEILDKGYEYHLDQETIRVAIKALADSLGPVSNTSVMNSTFIGEMKKERKKR